MTAYGATYIAAETERFRCPSISGISSSNNVTVFTAQASAPTPHFTLESSFGIRGDTAGGFAVSLSAFPIGLLDIYMRCNSSPTDRYVTSCPERYRIVESCDKSEDMIGAECVKLYEGTHKLVISAEVPDDKTCFTEELDRTPYGSAVADIALACDAFSPIDIAAAYRGDAPTELCCSKDQKTTLIFVSNRADVENSSQKSSPKKRLLHRIKLIKSSRLLYFLMYLVIKSRSRSSSKAYDRMVSTSSSVSEI